MSTINTQLTMKAATQKSLIALIILNTIANVLTYTFEGNLSFQMKSLAYFSVICFAFVHGITLYKTKSFLLFFSLVMLTAYAFEAISLKTGFPFGNYHFNYAAGFKLGDVAIMVLPVYFAYAYLSWIIAHVLQKKFTLQITKSSILTLPILASFVLVMFDLVLDPVAAAEGFFQWEDGGDFFGVPVSNFAGWFLLGMIVFTISSFYIKAQNSNTTSYTKVISNKLVWALPALMYGLNIIPKAIDALTRSSSTFIAEDKIAWQVDSLVTSMAVITFFTLFFVMVLSLINIYTGKSLKQPED